MISFSITTYMKFSGRSLYLDIFSWRGAEPYKNLQSLISDVVHATLFSKALCLQTSCMLIYNIQYTVYKCEISLTYKLRPKINLKLVYNLAFNTLWWAWSMSHEKIPPINLINLNFDDWWTKLCWLDQLKTKPHVLSTCSWLQPCQKNRSFPLHFNSGLSY